MLAPEHCERVKENTLIPRAGRDHDIRQEAKGASEEKEAGTQAGSKLE